MSEEENNEISEALAGDITGDTDETDVIQDFEQNGLLLKIAVNGIAVQDYVKRLKESDILVAVDGEIYQDGPVNLGKKFTAENNSEHKWLLTFWRDGELFDILLNAPIQSQFGLATQQETDWAMEKFNSHVYGEFGDYENYEIYRDQDNVCDILSLEKDPLSAILPVLWCLKFRLFPPLAAIGAAYLITFFINFYLFLLTYIILSRFVYVSQANILRSFTLYAGKSHYMTIAATNEKDVARVINKIDPKNKVRYDGHIIKYKRQVVHKVILNKSE